jgi:hypothetical protein
MSNASGDGAPTSAPQFEARARGEDARQRLAPAEELSRASGALAANASSQASAPNAADSAGVTDALADKSEALAKRKANTPPPHPADAPGGSERRAAEVEGVNGLLQHDPKAWLRHIEALRSEGKTAQANAEMNRFRAAFPTYSASPGAPQSH